MTGLSLVVARTTYHRSVCDQTDQAIRRQEAKRHDDRILERLQAILLLASVDDKDEDGRNWCWSSKPVFDGGATGVELGWYLLFGDVSVVWREVVTLQAKRANPYPSAHVDLADKGSVIGGLDVVVVRVSTRMTRIALDVPEGVQNRSAGRLASDRLIL